LSISGEGTGRGVGGKQIKIFGLGKWEKEREGNSITQVKRQDRKYVLGEELSEKTFT